MISRGLQASCPINVSDIINRLDDLTYNEGLVDRQAQELKLEMDGRIYSVGMRNWGRTFLRYTYLVPDLTSQIG